MTIFIILIPIFFAAALTLYFFHLCTGNARLQTFAIACCAACALSAAIATSGAGGGGGAGYVYYVNGVRVGAVAVAAGQGLVVLMMLMAVASLLTVGLGKLIYYFWKKRNG